MEMFFFMFISKKAEKIAFFTFFLPGLVKVFKTENLCFGSKKLQETPIIEGKFHVYT